MIRYIAILIVLGLVLAGGTASLCATITLDAAAKSATSDSPQLDAGKVKSVNDQLGFYVQNKSLKPQKVTLKITGLKDSAYDVYVNWGEFQVKRNKEISEMTKRDVDTSNIEPGYVMKARPAAELAAGLEFEIPGRVVPASLMRCVTAVGPAARGVYEGLGEVIAGEPGRARYTLGQAADWSRSAVMLEETYRSLQLFVIPAGITPKEMDWRSRYTAKGTKAAVANACNMLHRARSKMYSVLTDPLLRETTVQALTPVDVRLSYRLLNNAPVVKVDVTNNSNLDASGSVVVNLPKGWSMQPKQLGFAKLKSGDTYSKTIKLLPAAKGQKPPAELLVTAVLKVANEISFAKMQVLRRVKLENAK